jgi:hypothetical protein
MSVSSKRDLYNDHASLKESVFSWWRTLGKLPRLLNPHWRKSE